GRIRIFAKGMVATFMQEATNASFFTETPDRTQMLSRPRLSLKKFLLIIRSEILVSFLAFERPSIEKKQRLLISAVDDGLIGTLTPTESTNFASLIEILARATSFHEPI